MQFFHFCLILEFMQATPIDTTLLASKPQAQPLSTNNDTPHTKRQQTRHYNPTQEEPTINYNASVPGTRSGEGDGREQHSAAPDPSLGTCGHHGPQPITNTTTLLPSTPHARDDSHHATPTHATTNNIHNEAT